MLPPPPLRPPSSQSATNGHALSTLAFYLVTTHTDIASKLELDVKPLANFFSSIEAGYRNNPYHNMVHGADVLQVSSHLTAKTPTNLITKQPTNKPPATRKLTNKPTNQPTNQSTNKQTKNWHGCWRHADHTPTTNQPMINQLISHQPTNDQPTDQSLTKK